MDTAMTTSYAERLEETLPRVRERIAAAEDSAGRAAGSVRLVAVTKSHPFEAIRAALDAGLTDLGENRVEELEGKVAEFGADAATWHMIGHLQSRKAPRALEMADLIHSVDTEKLASKLGRAAEERGTEARVLVQVNTSGEASKSGFDFGDPREELVRVMETPGLCVEGLMTMAPFVDDEAVLTESFARLRQLSEALRAETDRLGPELSMGMTNDLEIAIREGSTMVRIGTALFGERQRF